MAPTRPLKPLLPLPAGMSAAAASSSSTTTRTTTPSNTAVRARRGHITHSACRNCSEKKSKCDGARPICGNCESKNATCVYEVAQGQTRTTALREQVRELEEKGRDLEEKVQGLEEHLNGILSTPNNEAIAYLEALTTKLSASNSHTHTQRTSSSLEQVSTRNVTTDVSQGRHVRLCSSIWATLPESRTITDCAMVFCRTITALERYGATIQHVEGLCSQLVDGLTEPHLLGEICAFAAVGARYSGNLVYQAIADDLYGVSNVLFTGLADQQPETALRMSVLLAVFAVPDRRKAAMGFVEFGISLARGNEFATRSDIRKAYNTLLYIKNWLAIALELPNADKIPLRDEQEQPAIIMQRRTVDDIVQLEVAKLSAITTHIQKCLYADLPHLVVSYRNSLAEWYDHLAKTYGPKFSLARTLEVDESEAGILYLHLVFFGGQLLLYRRLMLFGLDYEPIDERTFGLIPKDIYHEGAFTAQQVVSKLEQLYQCNSLYYGRTWLCIFTAYTSCATLVCGAVFQILNGGIDDPDTKSDLMGILAHAESALRILHTAPQTDALLMCFHSTLAPYVALVQSVLHYNDHVNTIGFPGPVVPFPVVPLLDWDSEVKIAEAHVARFGPPMLAFSAT
ncbi:hypothetical protein EJ05DRAFT_400830 [Pseudovirgaria hyperparasitica]|uniref:Zn(2)-C6 fungal-type domain-containing protein n=1 Tax=Pseudovirgaria hyperparasitica TaxID=470096 RepID=A0A6A6W5A7_9PEZI|nr:uncharacterized protein EJ05DRAFT_400830 [Pseudovirgaria hyperparasitica]KAF2757783.1 hypothetical protein EJ05DRAFT_400830 [Pseudovirgaria hyperparasitica]